MAEAKTAYLEPIDGDISPEKTSVEGRRSDSTPEHSVTPEFESEHKAEVSSDNETLYQKILSSVASTTPQTGGDVDADAQKVSLKADADSKVNQLVDLATVKGVVHAVKVARHLHDFYVLDQLHDDLANKLYETLKAKGLISA
jgi:hypothetical protein